MRGWGIAHAVQDNGSGMPHDDIPNMLGRVLSGTKYGVKQVRRMNAPPQRVS
jgi:DNA topoisomerase VI subunit B